MVIGANGLHGLLGKEILMVDVGSGRVLTRYVLRTRKASVCGARSAIRLGSAQTNCQGIGREVVHVGGGVRVRGRGSEVILLRKRRVIEG